MRQLIVIPVCMHFWGVEYFGEWLMISAVPTFLVTSNLGLGTATSIQVGGACAAGKIDEASEIYGGSNLILGLICGLVGLATLALLPFFHIVSDKYFPHIQYSGLVFLLLVLGVVLRSYYQLGLGWWTAAGTPARGNFWGNIAVFGDVILISAVPALGGYALSLSFALFAWLVVWLAFYHVSTFRVMAKVGGAFKLSREGIREAARLIPTGIGHQMNSFWQAIYFQGSIILSGVLLGATDGAATWGALRIVLRCGNQIVEVMALALGPEFIVSYHKGDIESMWKYYRSGVITCLSASVLLLLGGLVVLPPFFNWWTSGSMIVPFAAWLISLSSLFAFSMWRIPDEMLRSMNRPWVSGGIGIFCSVAALLITYGMAHLGILSFAIGTLWFDLLMAILISGYLFRTSSRSRLSSSVAL